MAGGIWTFALCATAGLVIALFLALTVHSRPLDNSVEMAAQRSRGAITFWEANGFVAHAGLNFTGPPSSGQHVLVYRSRPPAVLYPLYLLTLIDRSVTGSPFSLRLYVTYNQALSFCLYACFGFLGFRLARRLGAEALPALAVALTAEFLFATFPFNLERYFEPFPEQLTCLFLIALLIVDDVGRDAAAQPMGLWRAAIVLCLCYCDTALAVPGLAGYVLARKLDGEALTRSARLIVPAAAGVTLHWLQLQFVLWRYKDVVPAGGTFLWRSGLDGATSYVGALAPWKVGEHSPIMWAIGLVSTATLFCVYLFRRDRVLGYPISVIAAMLGFYLIPAFLLSQWAMIHFYIQDQFLALAAICVAWCVLAPYVEGLTGNVGLVTWVVVVAGFCLGMYQLRCFAVAHPLPIPEPNWRAYLGIG